MATQESADTALTLDDISALESFDAAGAPVLSVYLDVPPERRTKDGLRSAFLDLIRSLPDENARRESAHAAPLIDDTRGKSLAIFSCAARSFLQVYHLPVPVADHVAYERKADVGPLIALLDDYDRYVVALVDKARARLFTIHLGAVEEQQLMYEDIPQKHDQGGMSQNRLQRQHEEHVHWHLKDVVERLERLARERRIDRLVLAGPVEPISELRGMLPRALADRLIEVANLEFIAGDDDVLAKTLEIEQRAEREVEAQAVEQLAEAVAHERGTRGVADTLRALSMSSVMTLVVADGAGVPGVECFACRLLEPTARDRCVACGGPMEPTRNVVHRAMAHAIGQNASVQVVHGDAAQRLHEYEGVGAILRFPNPLAAPSDVRGSDVT
jgi:peptide chain release factor subunit 1